MPPDPSNAENTSPAPAAVRRVPPDLARCRAQAAGFGDYADCLTPGGCNCEYALHFGVTYLCLHPERRQIVARTLPPAR
jgi:hypothetical protein